MMPLGARIAEGGQVGLLDRALAGAHHDELLLFLLREFLHREERRDLLVRFQLDQVHDRLALAARADVGHLVDLEPVGPAAVREDHDVGVRRRDEEVADVVLLARPHADAPLAAAALGAIGGDRRPLDVAGVGHRDRHVLVGDQVLDPQLAALVDDLGPALVAELLAHCLELADHELDQQLLAREDGAQPLDRLHQLEQLVEDLLALEPGEPLQLHVEDRLRLELRQLELRHQPVARLGRALRSANQLDHFVEVIERDLEPFEDVGARLRLPQLELGPAPHDLAAELDEVLDDVEQRHDLAAGRRQSPA